MNCSGLLNLYNRVKHSLRYFCDFKKGQIEYGKILGHSVLIISSLTVLSNTRHLNIISLFKASILIILLERLSHSFIKQKCFECSLCSPIEC